MSQTFEIVHKYGTNHRGHAFIQHYWNGTVDSEDAFRAVAYEIVNGLNLKPGDIISPPPSQYHQAFDDDLVAAMRCLLPNNYHHGKTHIVSHILTIAEAAEIVRQTYGVYGRSLGSIGCGTLIVPESLVCDRHQLSDQQWIELIKPVPWIRLYRCETLVVSDLQT